MKSDGRRGAEGGASTECHLGACAATRVSPVSEEWASPSSPKPSFPNQRRAARFDMHGMCAAARKSDGRRGDEGGASSASGGMRGRIRLSHVLGMGSFPLPSGNPFPSSADQQDLTCWTVFMTVRLALTHVWNVWTRVSLMPTTRVVQLNELAGFGHMSSSIVR